MLNKIMNYGNVNIGRLLLVSMIISLFCVPNVYGRTRSVTVREEYATEYTYEFDDEAEYLYWHDASDPACTMAPAAFYGIWITASHDRSDCDTVAANLRSKGFQAAVYETTDWSNLNPVHWYAVSVGEYPTESAANNAIGAVINQGFSDAYVKYTGYYQG